MKNFEKASVA